MNTLQRIEKLVSEYRAKVQECETMLASSQGKVNRDKWNVLKQTYTTIIADLESIVDLSE